MDPRELDQRHRVLLVLWAALLGGMLVFAAVAWLLATGTLTGSPWGRSLDPGLVRTLLFVPVGLMVAGIFARRRGRPVGAGRDPVQALQTRVVLAAALQEAGGMAGIVLSLLAAQPAWILMMAGLAAFTMVRSRPRRNELEQLRRR